MWLVQSFQSMGQVSDHFDVLDPPKVLVVVVVVLVLVNLREHQMPMMSQVINLVT